MTKRERVAALTGLNYCGRFCGCGSRSYLWWFPMTAASRRAVPEWVPGWMNGADTDDIWRWLKEKGKVRK